MEGQTEGRRGMTNTSRESDKERQIEKTEEREIGKVGENDDGSVEGD